MEQHTFAFVFSLLAYATTTTQACSFPVQIQGFEGISMGYLINGTGGAVEGGFQIAYDVKRQKTVMMGEGQNMGTRFYEHVLDDYANGKEYVVLNGKCTISPLKRKMLTGIPSDAKKIMSSYYGFDDKKIGIDVYSFSYEGSQITISVMKEGCVPVGEHITGKAFLLDVGFMGMTSGVKNATVFDIPKPCQRSMPLSFLEHNSVEFLRNTRHFSSIH
ncbi:Hypothetical predicted protein [Mytilus galloprovincialis]|uniref:Uncharacterized protein n=1 Tax=Mytilus galloprovincialis TaxID=29158 RepID=A0A8B6FMG5_MYTGA|nr:Hypothetical predicted protein [Mytilus galloprovincialis]